MKKFYIDNEEIKEEGDFRKRLEDDIYWDCQEFYDEYIDSTEEDVVIFGLSYPTSYVLKAVDPVAYRCGLSDFVDSELSDALHDLNNGYEKLFNGIEYKIEDEEELEEDEEEEEEDE